MNKPILSIILSLIIYSSSFGITNDNSNNALYLIGEEHYSDADMNFVFDIMHKAAKKRLIYAKEGLERDNLAEKEYRENLQSNGIQGMSNGYLYGIEDPFFIIFKEALALNNLLRTMYKRYDTIDSVSEDVVKGAKNDLLCPLVTKTNQKFLQKFWDNKLLINNSIFKYLKIHKNALVKKTFTEQTKAFKQSIEKWNNASWIEFTQKVALILLEDIKEIIPGEKIETLNFLVNCLDEFELNSDCDSSDSSLGVEQTFLKSLHLSLRNDFLVKNLEEIYTETKKLKKPFVCIVGYAHVKGIKKALIEKGFKVLGKQELIQTLQVNKEEF